MLLRRGARISIGSGRTSRDDFQMSTVAQSPPNTRPLSSPRRRSAMPPDDTPHSSLAVISTVSTPARRIPACIARSNTQRG